MQRTIQTYYVPQIPQQNFIYRSPQRPIQQVQFVPHYQSPQRVVQYQGSFARQQIVRQQSPIQQIIVQPQIHEQQSVRVLSPQPSTLYIKKQMSPQVSLKNLIKESVDQQSTKKIVSPQIQPSVQIQPYFQNKPSYQPKFSNAVQEIKPSLDSRLSELDKKLQETLTKSFSITKYFKQKLDINKKIDFKLYNHEQDKKNISINDLNIEEVKNEKNDQENQ